VVTGLSEQHAVQAFDLGEHRAPRREQGVGDRLERRTARHQGQDARLEPALALADQQPKAPQEAAQLVAEIARRRDQLGPRRELGSQRVVIQALHPDVGVPAHACDLGQAAGIVAVGFLRPQRQLRLGPAGVDTVHHQALRAELMP